MVSLRSSSVVSVAAVLVRSLLLMVVMAASRRRKVTHTTHTGLAALAREGASSVSLRSSLVVSVAAVVVSVVWSLQMVAPRVHRPRL